MPLYIKAFREFKFSEVKEFQIAGQDFLLDLCGCCDILKPYMKIFVALQGLSIPCWKVVLWWSDLKDPVEKTEKKFFSLPLYMKAFREFKFSEVKKFQIAGQDFLLNLCGCWDVLKPYMEMFVALQGLSIPCWKVVVWWSDLKEPQR